jgi:soluble lytic murein transglycosylase
MKNITQQILLISILANGAFASKQISLQWLNDKPKSYAKDFYIWRYLKQDITPDQANKALGQVRILNNKIFFRYVNRSNNNILKDYKSCMQEKTLKLVSKKPYCIEAGLSLYDATKLSKNNLTKIIKKLQGTSYTKLEKKLKVLNSSNPFKTLQEVQKETFFDVFNQCGVVYRVNHFNKPFSKELIAKLQDDKKFTQTIKLIVTKSAMKTAQKSLLNISSKMLDFKATFFLAINAIKYNKKKQALNYLNDALKKAYYQMQIDNIIFWQYQLTQNKTYLNKLAKSWDVNIYSLFALNKLGKNHKGIVYNIVKKKNKKQKKYNTLDPFAWLKVLKDTKKLTKDKFIKYSKLFSSKDTLAHLAFVSERYNRYKKSYFITPYQKYIKTKDKNLNALVYAIARQESRFIPTSISTAYALGTMQIMPFLSKAIAKQLKEPYDIDKQLTPKTNIKYGIYHLKYLKKALHHPLLIAYAYNGGIGFTKRMLKEGLFKKGKYEPFLSMELLPYDETKKYGKKVLANYFIYQNYLNSKDKISFDMIVKQIIQMPNN